MADAALEKRYKALPLGERMALAVSDSLPAEYRPFMLREQWMQIKCYFARRADLSPDEYAALLDDDDFSFEHGIFFELGGRIQFSEFF